jgi:fission process protein 1
MSIHKPRALPAFTIHTAVKQAKKAFDKSSNPRLRAWGPTVTGLAIVPALPYIFDHPVEVAADRAFIWVEHELAKFGKRGGSSTD